MNKYYNTKTKQLEIEIGQLRKMKKKGYPVSHLYRNMLGELYGRYQGEAEFITMTGRGV